MSAREQFGATRGPARRSTVFLCCLFIGLTATQAARAQIFSPGDLSKAHESVEGLSNCMKCHTGNAGGYDNGKCLECHKEIAVRNDRDTGYHATVKSQKCAECHVEHRGRASKIIEWKPSLKSFNHVLTGWPLQGSHKKPECKDCHDVRLVADGEVINLVRTKGRESYLGVSTRCVTCHFDEHRGQEGTDCNKCHDTDKFKEAPLFNHNSKKFTSFPIVGKHKQVDCGECHEIQTDNADLSSFPTPRDRTFFRFKDVPHASCVACHEDHHRGAFGRNCTKCHTPDGWRIIKEGAQDTGFHDKHAFKLRGAHTSVSCRACHGPFRGQAAKFKGMKFQRCADCHMDAHVGQLKPESGAVRCEKCHTVNAFTPVLFTVAMHNEARFALEGSHQAVACTLCHSNDPKLKNRVPQKVASDLSRKQRPVLVSQTRLKLSDVFDAKDPEAVPIECDTCHRDPHAGQFVRPTEPPAPGSRGKACVVCHAPAASFAELKFQHDDSRFPLTGKHKDTACGSCHTASSKGKLKGVVEYRNLELACQSCHLDVHVGQLAKDGITACATCHSTERFSPGVFDHDKQSAFVLEGKHREVKCSRCHPSVEAKGVNVARYKPIPTDCKTCHQDQHKGAFDAFTPKAAAVGRCDSCHSAVAWTPAQFNHQKTGYELTGRHQNTACGGCHTSDYTRPVPMSCAGCHVDTHAQEFGMMCASCHTTERFEGGPLFAVDAHRRTNFPLTGRHGALPCDECHVEKRDRTFVRAAIDCASCHQADALQASLVTVDHAQAPFRATSCRSCHVPTTFAPARFPQHDVCFPIVRGAHAAIQCAQCHTAANLVGARADGDCAGVAVLCADCHTHRAEVEGPRHQNVPGYEQKSEKCAACHRSPR